MVNKRFWLGMLVMVLAFGMTVIGCDDGSTKVAEPTFPSSFRRSWIRDNFGNTLTFTSTTLKASNQNSNWNLTDVSGDSYTIATGNTTSGAITIKLASGNLEISGDSGTGENNWNGTWKPQPSFPSSFEGTWKRDNFDNTLTFTSTTIKSSSQNSTWNLADVAGDSYTSATGTTRATITINLVNGNLEISGDSGTGENNWNGTWKPQL